MVWAATGEVPGPCPGGLHPSLLQPMKLVPRALHFSVDVLKHNNVPQLKATAVPSIDLLLLILKNNCRWKSVVVFGRRINTLFWFWQLKNKQAKIPKTFSRTWHATPLSCLCSAIYFQILFPGREEASNWRSRSCGRGKTGSGWPPGVDDTVDCWVGLEVTEPALLRSSSSGG